MKRIVAIGGGTGLFVLLQGLKNKDCSITSIVSMMDDGGSSGILRDAYGVLPPGDIRRSLIALSESTELMKRLFSYRFHNGEGLAGHSLGNLIITALKGIAGSDAEAIKEAGRILNIRGTVLPVTTDNARLCAELEDGSIIRGETNIDIPKHDHNIPIKRIFLEPEAELFEDCRREILRADLIIIGPGDLYSSVLPNLLVKGICETILSSRAKRIYVCNLMTKRGETNRFTARDHIREVKTYLGAGLDGCIVNSGIPSESLLDRYEEEGSTLVKDDAEGQEIIFADLIDERDILRHDPDKLADTIMERFMCAE